MSNNEVVIYMVADKVLGAEIIGIERMRVIVKNQNRKEFIDEDGPDGAAPAPAVAAAPAVASVLGNGIKELSANKYTVPRSEIDKTLSNLNDVAMQARIVPSFKDGQANGFKVFSIRPDSIYSKIGVQNGDVISRINGYEINSPDKALEVYAKLKEASRIEVELDRNGQRVLKTYDVQ
jgi:general secretion pathway protein C